MRASGSHSIRYDGCVVDDSQLIMGDTRWGSDGVGTLVNATVAQIGLYASFHGIAERAAMLVRDEVQTRTKQPHGLPMARNEGIQRCSGEIEVLLETSRSMLERLGRILDDCWARPVAELDVEMLLDVSRSVQAAKLVTNRAAIDVVDLALTMSGGAGYMTKHPLSRLYRDVRAGPFMQPTSPVDAPAYIGRLSLGLDPHPD